MGQKRSDPQTSLPVAGRGDLTSAFALSARGAWETAFETFTSLDHRFDLNGEALEGFGVAAYMSGREESFGEIYERAFEKYCTEKKDLKAARCAFWIGLTLIFRDEFGRGSGWLSRAERQVENHGADCVEIGYLLLPQAEESLAKGDAEAGYNYASRAAGVAARYADEDLLAIARHLQGRIKMEAGQADEGLALLDETMIAVTSGGLTPIVTGLVYCSVIEICQNFLMQGRAKEWTAALAGWCSRQPEIVAFTGRCQIHRAEILIFDGNWSEAFSEASAACSRLIAGPVESHAGPAYYQEGEVLRLRGSFSDAEKSYRSTSRLGYDPQPGVALMRLQQGKGGIALASITRALASAKDPVGRVRLLPSAIRIMLAVGSTDSAREALDELRQHAALFPNDAVRATAAEALGTLRLAEGDAESALVPLHEAATLWRQLNAPYQLAQVRFLTGQTCLALGDKEGGGLEIEAAGDAFAELGAEPDKKRVDDLVREIRNRNDAVLTPRQSEILQLVAEGLTNREIAGRLKLSERTVDRHVSNILTRIDVPTRAAATAFALAQGLIGPVTFG
jgi:DNA-binding CsgD family transcriptional regulator